MPASNTKTKILISLLSAITLIAICSLFFIQSSNKKQIVKQKEMYIAVLDSTRTFLIDSMRKAVIDSMDRVFHGAVEKSASMTSEYETSPIELYDLINLFTPEYSEYGILSEWNTEANNKDIIWLTKGIEMYGLGFYRNGEVAVTINKQELICLSYRSYPCKWDIILTGPRPGYTSFSISGVNHRDLDPMTLDEMFKGREFTKQLIKKEDYTETYKVIFPKKNPLRMEISWSCGSAGCSLSIDCETDVY